MQVKNNTATFLYSYLFLVILVSTCFDARSQDASIVTPSSYGSSSSNFVRTFEVVRPTQDPTTITALPTNTGVRISTQYFDGLGRQLQTVVKGASLVTPNPGAGATTAYDVVSPTIYDEYSREIRHYLPYTSKFTSGDFRINPFKEQRDWYDSASPITGQGYTMYYSKTEYEASPLNRPLRQYGTGDSWVKSGSVNGTTDRSVKTTYTTNTSTDLVRLWTVTEPAIKGNFGTYKTTTNYAPGTLYKTIINDEEGVQTIEYKDLEGRVVMKKVLLYGTRDNGSGSANRGWQCTYYIYDDLGQLRAVLQPRGTELIRVPAVEWDLSKVPTIDEQQFFRYEFDERGRMIMKQVPGAMPVYMVYDTRDRLVMTQDGLLRSQNAGKWAYTAYDNLNRPVSTGLVTLAGSFLNHLDAAASSTAYPAYSAADELTHTYYDDYSWLNGNFPEGAYDGTFASAFLMQASNMNYPYPITPQVSAATRGMVTGTRVKVLDGSGTYLWTAMHYDDRGRVIQVKSRNLKGGVDVTATQYSYGGLPLLQVVLTNNTAAPSVAQQALTIATLNTFDELGRLIQVDKKINSPTTAWKKSAYYQYNALGQMQRRRLGTQSTAAHRASLVYDYNIRGWMTAINKDYLYTSNNTTAFFGMDLNYDKAGLTAINKQYNGNIAAIHWRSRGDFIPRKYQFAYDVTNRLLRADFTQREGSTWTNSNVNFDVKMGNGVVDTLAYDMNGNIRQMQQWGLLLAGSQQIDNLKYDYWNGAVSNKLFSVTDSIRTLASPLSDFRDNSFGMMDYAYDQAGNLAWDANKGIESITYNHLNLPEIITFTNKGTVTYTYDASGIKLRKVVFDQATNRTTTTLYLGNAVYSNDTLQLTAHEEGRIRYRQGDASFQWDYFLKDHLGNVRMVVTEEVKSDPYATLSFEDALKTEQNRDWENRTGKSIGVDGVRTSVNDRYAMLSRRSTGSIGAAKLLKVMSGDRIHTQVDFFYTSDNASATNNGSTAVNSVVSALVGSISAGTAAGNMLKNGTSTISSNLGANPDLASLLSTAPAANTTTGQQAPKAYLCILFFDERMQLDKDGSRVIPVSYLPNSWGQIQRMASSAISAPKNGYAYVYVTNESDELVYWDNFMLTHERGAILEENHYYPFGTRLEGICSRAASSLENMYQYNGKELQRKELTDGAGLEWLDYGARMYDAQIGRFFTQDRFSEKYYGLSPYQYGANNPINNIDVNGDSIWVPILMNAETALSKYHYYGQVDGRWGLVGTDGKLYSGNDAFAGQIVSALNELRTGGEFGSQFIGNLATGSDNIKIHSYTADNVTDGGILYVNPGADQFAPTERGSQRLPFSIILGHEMAHGLANVQGVKFKDWTTILTAKGDKTLSQAEIYATHIENNLRGERGMPLRTHYSQDPDGIPVNETIILDSRGRSLFYNTGNTNPGGNSYPRNVPADNRYIYRRPRS